MSNILIFGDSITHGASDSELGGWTNRLKVKLLQEGRDISLYSLGINGDNTNDLLKRFKQEASVRCPEKIIFSIGINDSQFDKAIDGLAVPLHTFKENLLELIKQAREFTKDIAFVGLIKGNEELITPTSWNPDKYYHHSNSEAYDLDIKLVCKKENLKYVYMYDLMKHEDLADGLHPTALGHQKIMERVYDKLFSSKI